MEQFIPVNQQENLSLNIIEPIVSKHTFLKKHLNSYKIQFAVVIFWGLLQSLVSFFLTLLIGNFFILQFDTGSSKGILLHWLGVNVTSKETFFFFFLFLIAIKFISSYFERYLSLKLAELFVRDIRQELFSVQMQTDKELFTKKTYGKYLLRYSNDLKAVQNYLAKGILGGIKDCVFVLIGLLILLNMNVQIAMVIILLFIVASFIVIYLWNRQKIYISNSRSKRSSLLALVSRSFGRFSYLLQNRKELITIEQFNNKSDELFLANLENGKVESLLQSLIPVLLFIIIGFVLLFIETGTVHISGAKSLTIILMLMLMQGAFRRLLKVPGILNKGRISLDKINQLVILSSKNKSENREVENEK